MFSFQLFYFFLLRLKFFLIKMTVYKINCKNIVILRFKIFNNGWVFKTNKNLNTSLWFRFYSLRWCNRQTNEAVKNSQMWYIWHLTEWKLHWWIMILCKWPSNKPKAFDQRFNKTIFCGNMYNRVLNTFLHWHITIVKCLSYEFTSIIKSELWIHHWIYIIEI